MEFKTATMADFDVAFDYIEKLWTYNTYDKEVIRKVYADVLADENSFAFSSWTGTSITASATGLTSIPSGSPA